MKPRQAERKTFAQRCYGTQALITRGDAATGKIGTIGTIGTPMIGNHRTEDVYSFHGQQLGSAIEKQPAPSPQLGTCRFPQCCQTIDSLIASVQTY